jgi:ABC-2 type transport system permease protein
MSVDSVIHDIGYQRYTGPKLGREYAVSSLFQHGLRTAYGLGRPAKSKIFPWAVAFIVTTVAVVFTAIRAQTGEPVMTYTAYTESMGLLAILFVAIVAPELVSRDLRSGVLPLYFTRALRAGDYALAKLAALITAVWLLLGAPQLIMFLGGAFDGDSAGDVWDEFLDLLQGLSYAGIHAVVFSSLALLISALTGKRAFAAGGIVAVFLMTGPITGVLSTMPSSAVHYLAGLPNPAALVQGDGDWLYGNTDALNVGNYGPAYGLTTVVFVAACVALLLARYRRVAAR